MQTRNGINSIEKKQLELQLRKERIKEHVKILLLYHIILDFNKS